MDDHAFRATSCRAPLMMTVPSRFTSAAITCLCTKLLVLSFFVALFPGFAVAQFSATNGWAIQLTGMVQVEPSSNVIELEIKGTKIRFAVHDMYSSDRTFSAQQFLSELRRSSSSMRVRSPEDLQDFLLNEKPSKRVLKLTGRYYPDSRLFLLDRVDSLPNKPPPES